MLRSRKNIWFGFFFFAVLVLGAQSSEALNLKIPLPEKGKSLSYDIIWRGDKIGEHIISISHVENQTYQVSHVRNVSVDTFIGTIFSESHQATEHWDRQAHLIKLKGHTILNGKRYDVKGHREQDGRFALEVDGMTEDLGNDVTTVDSYWAVSSIEHESAIDVSNARVLQHIRHTQSKSKETYKGYHIEGEGLEADIWYENEFMSKATITKDGHKVHYLLKDPK
jgi:hypothetical protein